MYSYMCRMSNEVTLEVLCLCESNSPPIKSSANLWYKVFLIKNKILFVEGGPPTTLHRVLNITLRYAYCLTMGLYCLTHPRVHHANPPKKAKLPILTKRAPLCYHKEGPALMSSSPSSEDQSLIGLIWVVLNFWKCNNGGTMFLPWWHHVFMDDHLFFLGSVQ